MFWRTAPSLLLALGLLPYAPVRAQIEEEDLPVHEAREGVDAPTFAAFEQAVDLLRAGQIEPALPLLDEVVAALQSGPAPPPEAARELWLRALEHRARARSALGEAAAALGDLEALILLDPAFTFSEGAPQDLLTRLEERRRALVGKVALRIAPPDATVQAIPRPAEPETARFALPEALPAPTPLAAGQQTPVHAGRYRVVANRPGFTEQSVELEVNAGELSSLELTLERTSAAVQLATRPPGATVLVDGSEAGTTTGSAPPELRLAEADHLRSEYSDYLWIDGLSVGTHEVEIRKPGYRPFRARLAVDEPRDIRVQPVALEPEIATVVLLDLPAGATVQANGRVVQPLASADPARLQIELRPGTYRLSISRPVSGVFETELDLADRQTMEIAVRLRPAVVLLSVMGGDETVASRVRDALEEVLGDAPASTLLDRSLAGKQLLAGLGLSPARLRELGARPDGNGATEWPRLQAATTERIEGWIYALAVLDDDLLAREVQLWLFPPAPLPSRPDLRRMPLDDRQELERLAASLATEPGADAPFLGASLIDSDAAGAPVVAHLTGGGPAQAAGLALGDAIISIDGTPAFTVAQLAQAIARRAPGESVALEVRSPRTASATVTRSISLRLGAGRSALELYDPDTVFAARAAQVAQALLREGGSVPRWQLLLDRALLELRAGNWERSVEILRGIRAPELPGLGQGTVDYLLGLALLRLGPRYLERAREAFTKAAASGGRLLSDDGPWLGPLARARLEALP